MKPKVSIDRQQFYRLVEWMKKNADLLTATKPTRPEAAALAAKELGFPMVESAIKDAEEVSGVTWDSGRGNGNGKMAVLLREVALGQTLVASHALQPSEELKRAIREHLGRLKALSNGTPKPP